MLKNDISKLEHYESVIDTHKSWIEQSIINITEDIDNKKFLYVSHEDFSNCHDAEEIVFALNGPTNSCIQIEDRKRDFDLKITSSVHPINANLRLSPTNDKKKRNFEEVCLLCLHFFWYLFLMNLLLVDGRHKTGNDTKQETY